MRIILCCTGSLLIFYALSIAKETGATTALVVGAIGIGLLIFSDARR